MARSKINAALFNFVKVRPGSIIASNRIASFVAEQLSVPIVDDEKISLRTDLDVLLIVNGAYAFSKTLPELAVAIRGARRVVWIQNDYTIIPPKAESGAESPFRLSFRMRHDAKLPPIDYWTTVADNTMLTKQSHYVNWNCLTFDEQKKPDGAHFGDVVYYGSFRSQRRRYFDRYFQRPSVKHTISSPSGDKFRDSYPSNLITHEGKIAEDLGGWLSRRGLGLYLEDRPSHSNYHSPANRFYEMLSAGLPIAFQPETGSMMRRAGYDPEPYFVSSPSQVGRMLAQRAKTASEQREAWLGRARDERKKRLPFALTEAWGKTLEALR